MFEISHNLIYIERKLRIIRVTILTHFSVVQRNADMFYLKSVNLNLNFLQRILTNSVIKMKSLLKPGVLTTSWLFGPHMISLCPGNHIPVCN